MIEFGLVAQERRGGGKAAGEVGDAIAIKEVAFTVVLRMDQHVRHRNPPAKIAACPFGSFGGAERVGHRGEVGFAEFVARLPGAIEGEITGARTIAARSRTKDARQALALASDLGERVVGSILIERGDAAHGDVEQRDLLLEDVTEQAGNAQRHVNSGPVEGSERHDLYAGHATGMRIPERFYAQIGQRLRKVVPAGAQRRRGPEIDHQGLRRLTMILKVAANDLVGRPCADRRRRARRNGARIDGGEVAACGQHVGPPPARRTCRTRRHAPAVERRKQAGAFSDRTCFESEVVHAAKHMQPVADREVLDVAKMRVELGHRSAVLLAAHQAAIGGKAVAPSARDDLLLEKTRAAAIEAIGRGILLDDTFHLRQRAVQAGSTERRREMTDRDGGQPAFGLGRFARIVDDERVDDGNRPQHLLRPTFCRQGQRLAGQPFERAMRAEVDERIDLLFIAQPGIGGDIVRVRLGRGVVISATAIGLQQDDDLAAAQMARRTIEQRRDVRRLPVTCADVVARIAQQPQDLERAFGGIEADGVAGAAAARRIVRQDKREPALVALLGAQPCPGRRQARHVVDTSGVGDMTDRGELQLPIGVRCRLERNGARQQPAIEFRQHDVHGQVGRREATAGLGPGLAGAAGEHDLEDGGIGRVEHSRIVLAHRREGSGVENDRGPAMLDQPAEFVLDGRVLEAAHGHAERHKSPPLERRHQVVDRLDVGRDEIGTIEDDEGERSRLAGITEHGDWADGSRRPPRVVAAQQGADVAERLVQVVGPAVAEEAIEHGKIGRRDRGHGGKPRILTIVTGQGSEQDAAVARQVGNALQAVAPVVEAAQTSHDDGLGPRHDIVEIEIGRHGMAQLLKVGEAQRRKKICVALPGNGKGREVGVGE